MSAYVNIFLPHINNRVQHVSLLFLQPALSGAYIDYATIIHKKQTGFIANNYGLMLLWLHFRNFTFLKADSMQF